MNQKPELPAQTNYQDALRMARERLARLDFDRQCLAAGLEPEPPGARLQLIDRLYLIGRDDFDLTPADNGPPAEVWEKIVALHYLVAADGSPPAGKLITYKQVPDGAPYYEVFLRRTSGILLSVFNGRFDALVKTARKLGAREVSGHGDRAFCMDALPRVSYVFVIYEADEDFPADIKVLFDATVNNYLPAEDITVLCQMACLKIVKSQ